MRLQIRNATVEYGADVILDKICFEIADREKIAVVGRNGCGKTTLLKLISGELSAVNPDSDESFQLMIAGGQNIGWLRQISFTDNEISAEDEIKKEFKRIYECRDRMAEIEASLSEAAADDPSMQRLLSEYDGLQKVYDSLEGADAERQMYIMFQKFGFALDDLKRPMGTFSGGQQTKIAFIKLLLRKPDILLLDEPTNHLDLPTIEWLEEYLKNYKKAVVIVSHDRVFLDNITTVTYEIEYHRMKRYAGNYSAFVKQKEEALLKQQKDYEAQQKEIKRLSDWVEKWKNTPTKVSTAHSKEKAIEHMVLIEKPRRFDTTTFRAHFSPRISSYNEVLNVQKLQIGYDHVLSCVSFRLMRGERLAIVGENGKGKSTLLKTIMGMVKPLGGRFTVGTNVEVGYYDQQEAIINNDDPQETILDNFWNEYPKLTNEQVRSTLGAFAFSGEEVEKKIGQLSGGEKVRLALCKMFYTKPNFLILDEPTNHMDILGKESLEQMLKNYEGTVLFVSHDRYFIKEIATQVLNISSEENMPASQPSSSERISSAAAGHAASAGDTAPSMNYRDQAALKNPGKLRSRLQSRLEKLHAQLEESEQAANLLKESMSDPSLASDYEKLLALQSDLEKEEGLQEDLLMQILESEEELNELNLMTTV